MMLLKFGQIVVMEKWFQDDKKIIILEFMHCQEKNDIGPRGIYYHVTFYDLQASNHLTLFPIILSWNRSRIFN